MQPRALMIGNSDGIGLATTKKLLSVGWRITGISKSETPIMNDYYYHHIADVSDCLYAELLERLVAEHSFDLCVYFAGIGKRLDLSDMSDEARIIDINLTGMVRTAATVIPQMVKNGRGHFIGISSVADELLSADAPSYHASKAGFSSYLKSLAIALGPAGVKITNLRFGFVDTKMAKGDVKPFMMTVDRAVYHLENCLKKKPTSYTAPKTAIPLIKFRKIMMKLGGK